MVSISLKISYYIIMGGLFVIVILMGLNYATLTPLSAVVFLLLVLFIFLFGFSIGESFNSPVKQILKRANELSKGDYKGRFYLDNKDEFGELAKIFNKMGQEFERRTYEMEKMEKTAEIKAKTRILILEEVIEALERKIKNRSAEFERVAAGTEKLQTELRAKNDRITELMKEVESKKKKPAKKETTEV